MKTKPQSNEVRITFYADEELHRAFKATAALAGSSMQAVMMKLVRDWLAAHGALPAPIRKQARS